MVHKERLKFAGLAALVSLAILVLLPIEKSSVEKQVAVSILRQQEAVLAEFDPTSTILRGSSDTLRTELERRLRAVGERDTDRRDNVGFKRRQGYFRCI